MSELSHKSQTNADPETARRIATINAAAGARGWTANAYRYHGHIACDIRNKDMSVIRENLLLSQCEAILGIS